MFNAKLDGKGKTFSFTFTKPGTYTYYCDIHQGMNATITVVADTTSSEGAKSNRTSFARLLKLSAIARITERFIMNKRLVRFSISAAAVLVLAAGCSSGTGAPAGVPSSASSPSIQLAHGPLPIGRPRRHASRGSIS